MQKSSKGASVKKRVKVKDLPTPLKGSKKVKGGKAVINHEEQYRGTRNPD